MKKYVVNIEKTKAYLFNLIAVITIYGLMLHKTLRSDHIWAAVQNSTTSIGILDMMKGYLLGGRPGSLLVAFILKIFSLFGIDKLNSQFIIQALFFAIIIFASSEIYFLFADLLNIESFSIIVDIIILIGFVNPIFVELLSWIGFEHGIAIVLSGLIATKLFVKKHYIGSFVSLFFAISIYQSYYAPFLIYSIAYIFISHNERISKHSAFSILKALLITATAAGGNIALTKITSLATNSAEVKTISLIGNNGVENKIVSIIEWIYMIVTQTYGMMPAFFVIGILSLIFLMILCYKKKNGESTICVGNSIVICVVMALVPFGITIAMSSVGLETRVMASYFMAISMCFLIAYDLLRKSEFLNFCVKKFKIILFCFFIVDIFCTETVILDFFISNSLDIAEAKQINEIINQYEDENDVQIKKIAFRVMPDSKGANTYSGFYHFNYVGYVFLSKLNHDEWCTVELINYVNNENYEKIEMTDLQYELYFGNTEDTSIFNPYKQLVFVGDTLFWAIE